MYMPCRPIGLDTVTQKQVELKENGSFLILTVPEKKEVQFLYVEWESWYCIC